METAVSRRLGEIRKRIDAAAKRAGRDPADVVLLAVTKTCGRETVIAAYEAGIRVFGENRVQEAAGKYAGLPDDIELHLIGHLQTNKAKTAAEVFRWVDSIDSLRAAAALDGRLAAAGRTADVLLELNTSGEASKSGYADFAALLSELPDILALPRLRLRGLLTVGPLSGGGAAARASFRSLKNCFDRLKAMPGCGSADVLSMGMSSDFEIAVEEGATMVRLGTALFGERPA